MAQGWYVSRKVRTEAAAHHRPAALALPELRRTGAGEAGRGALRRWVKRRWGGNASQGEALALRCAPIGGSVYRADAVERVKPVVPGDVVVGSLPALAAVGHGPLLHDGLRLAAEPGLCQRWAQHRPVG
jgi:hypothetical protein